MAFQPVPDVLEVIFDQQRGSGLRYQNTMYFRNPVAWTNAAATTVATAAGNAFRDEVMPLVHSTSNFWRVRYKDIGAEFGVEGEIAYNTNGGQAGDALTLALAVGITFRASGPPKQGRLFVSGFAEAQVAGDLWVGTLASDVRDAVQAIAVAGEGALVSTEHVIVSRFANNTKRAQGVASDVGTYQFHSNIWAQRDRRAGIGT